MSSGIASATKSARDTVATRSAKRLADYPPCAVRVSSLNFSYAVYAHVSFDSFDAYLTPSPRADARISMTLSALAGARPSTRLLGLVSLLIVRGMIF